MTFVDYVHSFYGKGGVYELCKDGKPLTRRKISAWFKAHFKEKANESK